MKLHNGLIAILAIFLLTACSGVPSYVIPPEKMARLMADLEIAESIIEMEPAKFRGDSAKMVLLQSIYERHGVDRARVDTSYVWYGHHIDRYQQVTKRSIEILMEDEKRAREASGLMAQAEKNPETVAVADGDSVDVWPMARYWRISHTSPSRVIAFNLSRDRNFEPGDGFELRFKVKNALNPVDVAFAADCNHAPTIYSAINTRGDGWKSVKLQLDSAATLSSLYGMISYSPKADESLVIDSLALVRTHWKKRRAVVPVNQKSISR